MTRIFPHFKFVHSSSDENVNVKEGLRAPIVAFANDFDPNASSTAEEWQHIEMFVVVVPDGQKDPWRDADSWSQTRAETQDTDAYLARALHTAYARILLSRQQRNFAYSMQVAGKSVRLFRWDWAGAVVSGPCNILQEPQLFGTFFVKLNALTSAERGWDTIASVALTTEQQLLTDAIKDYVARVQAREVPMLPHLLESVDTNWPAYTVHLPREYTEIGTGCTLIIQRPFMSTGTRAYYAYHLEEKRLVFYKISWTTKCPCFEQLSEGFASWFNQERDVRHTVKTTYASSFFPRLERSGYKHLHINFLKFRGQPLEETRSTVVHRFAPTNTYRRPKARLDLVQDLAYPLQYATNSRQLVRAILNTLLCMYRLSDASSPRSQSSIRYPESLR